MIKQESDQNKTDLLSLLLKLKYFFVFSSCKFITSVPFDNENG